MAAVCHHPHATEVTNRPCSVATGRGLYSGSLLPWPNCPNCMRTSVCVCLCVCMCVCVCVCMYVCALSVCVCVQVCVCALSVCVCAFVRQNVWVCGWGMECC